MAKEVKILDLPESQITGQDYILVVQPDGTHNKGRVEDITDQLQVQVEQTGYIGEMVAEAEAARDGAVAAATGVIQAIGSYDASTGIAFLYDTGSNFTPTSVSDKPNGNFLEVTVAGTRAIAVPPGGSAAASIAMAVGATIRSGGVGKPWGYIPPKDTGFQRSLNNEGLVYKLSEDLFTPITVTGWRYKAKGRGTAGSKLIQPDITFDSTAISWGGVAVDITFRAKIRVYSSNIASITSLLTQISGVATPGVSGGSQITTGGASGVVPYVEIDYVVTKNTALAKQNYIHNIVNFDPIDENVDVEIIIYNPSLTIGGVAAVLVGSALYAPNGTDTTTAITQLNQQSAAKPYVDAQLAGKAAVTLADIVTSRNLYNPAAVQLAYIVNATGATVTTGQALTSKLSDFIAVEPNTNYYISGRNVATGSDAVAYYDVNKVLVSTPPFGDSWQDGPVNGVYTTGPTTRYMRVQTSFNGVGTDEAVQIEKGSVPSSYVPYSKSSYISAVNGTSVISNVANDIQPVYDFYNSRNPLYGKYANFFGDSITQGSNGVGETNTYWAQACARNNMTGRNYGIAGTRLSTDNGSGLGMSNPARYTAMDDNADFIIVFGGTNDVAGAVPITDGSDTTNATYKGALNILCVGLMEKYPTKKIGFITLFNHRTSNGAQPYADATLEICGKYAIPVLDWFRESNVYPLNTIKRTAQMINSSDFQHPSIATHLQLSYSLENFLRSM